MTNRTKPKYYAVIRGRQPGIYRQWYGPQGAEVQVRGYPGALFRGYTSREEAERALAAGAATQEKAVAAERCTRKRVVDASAAEEPTKLPASEAIEVFTDGGCRFNPGPGGYGVVIIEGGQRRELSGGFRHTTNNRMELMACIVALAQVAAGRTVQLHSDSRYVVDAMRKGWAHGWQKRGWRRSSGEPALNPDLWQRLLELCTARRVSFLWVRGHAGHPENERCDRLAVAAAAAANLPPDEVYEGQVSPAGGLG